MSSKRDNATIVARSDRGSMLEFVLLRMLERAPHVSSTTRMSRSPLSRAIRLTTAAFTIIASATSACARPADTLSAAERAAIGDTLQRMIVAAYDITKPGDRVGRMMS